MSILPPSDCVPTGSADTLVVLLHGVFLGRANPHLKSLRFVREAITETLDNVDILMPNLPFGPFSFVDLNALAWELVALIDQAWVARMRCADGRPYRQII